MITPSASEFENKWLIDMANGYMHKAIGNAVKRISEVAKIDNLMVGNVHTAHGLFNLVNELSFLDCPIYIRVGIAGGSPSSTNDSTGYNRGQITEINECADWLATDSVRVSYVGLGQSFIVRVSLQSV